jgi:peptidoglycan/LPS O-acetylase OafA/YrhL
MVLALLHQHGIFARFLRWRFLREWGRVSYCVYLIHLGILSATHWALLHSPPRINDWRAALTTLLAAAITWGIAQLSWRFFEKPLIDRGHALSKAQLESSAVV